MAPKVAKKKLTHNFYFYPLHFQAFDNQYFHSCGSMTSEYVMLNDNIMAIPLFITSSVKRCGGSGISYCEANLLRAFGCYAIFRVFIFNLHLGD
ncbi:hypothetical protein Hdeb2414_s0001g00024321 [Helianthus debilis subsp. tardiflorus]